MKVAGIDVSRGSVTIAVLEEVPEDLRKLKRRTIKLKADAEGIKALLALDFDCAILEPSGGHYSKIWAHHLTQAGREIRWVGHQEISHYRESLKIANKTDQLDALALAAYGIERYNRPSHFIRGAESGRLRELWLQLKHYNRAKNPLANRLRQQLCSEFPEVAERDATRGWLKENPPGLWQFIAAERDSAKWEKEYTASIGIGLSEFSRGLARQICEIERQEYEVERLIEAELQQAHYRPYLKIFEDYGIAQRTAAALLSEIYPFQRFLKDGHQVSEYYPTEKGRARRNRSLGAFKLSCGLGMTYYQSGDAHGWKPGGNNDVRMALWLWCKMAVVIKPRANLPKVARLIEYYQNGSRQIVDGEEKHFNPGIRNQRIMRVVRRMLESLYKDLLKEFSNP